MEKATEFTEDNDEFTGNDMTHRSLKKLENIVEETYTQKKGTTLILPDT